MKQLFLWGILLLFATSCSITQYTVEPPPNVDVPENAVFIAQSGTQTDLMQTVIDLDNGEMVVLSYRSHGLISVIRTGIYLNPKDYKNKAIVATDAPFVKEEKKEIKDED